MSDQDEASQKWKEFQEQEFQRSKNFYTGQIRCNGLTKDRPGKVPQREPFTATNHDLRQELMWILFQAYEVGWVCLDRQIELMGPGSTEEFLRWLEPILTEWGWEGIGR